MKATSSLLRIHILAQLLCTIIAIGFTIWLLAKPRGVITLFARWDVVMVTMLASWPLTTTIANRLHFRNWKLAMVVVAASIALAGGLFTITNSSQMICNTGLLSGTALRSFIAFFVLLPPILMISRAASIAEVVHFLDEKIFAKHAWLANSLFLIIAIMIPAAYVDTLSVWFRTDLENSLQSRRFALAERQISMLAELHPSDIINDKPIATAQHEIGEIVERLEATLRISLSLGDTLSQRRSRITAMMQLDRNEQALLELEPLTQGPSFQAASLDYQGLCYQRLEKYAESVEAYRMSIAHWQTQPESDQRNLSLASGWKGIGYAARRLNQRTLEENAYRELVRLSPTADNHLLLAQCYREHQKTRLASQHLLKASQLNPKLQSQSATMLDSMSTDHFSCWLVPRQLN